MDKIEIVINAILSVDQNYMNERYKESYVLRKLFYGETLTPEHKQTVRRVCRDEYPGGEIVAVIDRGKACNFKDGYLFTDEGFYPTKSSLIQDVGSKNRGVPPLKYGDIVSVEVMKKYGGDSFVRVTTNDGGDYMGYASIYAPYICEVLKKIKEALQDAEKNGVCLDKKAEPAQNASAENIPQPNGESAIDPLEAGLYAMQENRIDDAVRFFQLAAKRGDLEAVYCIAVALGNKAGTLEEYEEAIRYLQYYKKKGGQEDTDDLMKLLFKYYYLLKGVKLSEENKWDEAEEVWLKSAQLGNEGAMLRLAVLFMTHDPTEERLKKAQFVTEKYRSLTKDDKRADELLKSINGKRKLLQAQEAMDKKDYETARKAAEEAAMCGDRPAMYLSALLLGATDRERALNWLDRFEQAGGDPADTASLRQRLQGDSLMIDAIRLAKDKKWEEAIPLFRQAAEQGVTEAMFHLAVNLVLGTETMQGLREALSWAQKYQQEEPGVKADELVRDIQARICLFEGSEAEERDDVQKAMECYERAWSFKDSDGLRSIAILLWKQAKSEAACLEAMKWAKQYQGCADNEGADELLEVIESSRLFWAGIEAEKKNHNGEAISLYRKAAKRGHGDAMRLLAVLLSDVGKTKEEFDEAHYWANELREHDQQMGVNVTRTVTTRMMKVLPDEERSEILDKYPGARDAVLEVVKDYLSLQNLFEEGKSEIEAGYIDEGLQLLHHAVNEGFTAAVPLLAKTLLLDKGGKADIQEAICLLKQYESVDEENNVGMLANAIGIGKVKYALTPELCKDLSPKVLNYIRNSYPDLYDHLLRNRYIK